MRPRRLLSIGHSYVVGANRALPESFARVGGGDWEVTVAAPERFPGDLGMIEFQRDAAEACRTVAVPVRGARRIHLMRYGAALRSLLAEPWDVVHCWEEPYVLPAAQVSRWAPRRAALVYATFQNIRKRYPPPFGALERYTMKRADGWVAFGHTTSETLRDRPAYEARPHRIIAPGVDTDRFAPDADAGGATRHALGWPVDGPPVIGFLGRFVPGKGWATLTAALDGVDMPWRALFVGGGADEAALRAWAARHGDRVRVVTGVPHAHVPAFLNAMDVLCAPSRTLPRWREQFGRMLTEALASGVPVIASTSGEIPHVLGDAGVLVDEADTGEWVSAIGALLAGPERRAQLADAGRQRALAHFALDHVARQHLAFFDELAGRRA
jgi:phosphatidylinositol alpha-1,6-mannosyltransferase